MPHDTPLVATIVVGLSLAFVLGALAQRVRISPLVGYLLAGVLVGPHTPGFVADQEIANELAEIGVILLMFGVGLHFSLEELWSVRAIAIPGAIAQMAVATLLGLGLARYLGWPTGSGLVLGLALSVASTVVLLRALQERRLVASERGRIAVGWLIVEDIAMVLALVLLPALAPVLGGKALPGTDAAIGGWGLAVTLAVTLVKVAAFVVLMMVVGSRIIPWVMHYIAHTGSRELFRLGVLAIALGVAFGAAKLFGVSFALGAFFAGMILSESELSQRAAAETLPLRDAFAVLFFISVGMLFDPTILARETLPVLATLAIIVVGKSLAAMAIVLAFRHPPATALMIAASLAQIGEFSFILAGLGVDLGLLSASARDLVLAGALLSIMINPLLFLATDKFSALLAPGEGGEARASVASSGRASGPVDMRGHAVLVGYGRVGRRVGRALAERGIPLFVIDEQQDAVRGLDGEHIKAASGNPHDLLADANLAAARALVVTIAGSIEAGQIVTRARAGHPQLTIIARAASEEAAAHLSKCGASVVVLEPDEVAAAFLRGCPADGKPFPAPD
ncbi:MAG: YbaL family putative K(+) efflux transporter [Pseudomonadota bacterium]